MRISVLSFSVTRSSVEMPFRKPDAETKKHFWQKVHAKHTQLAPSPILCQSQIIALNVINTSSMSSFPILPQYLGCIALLPLARLPHQQRRVGESSDRRFVSPSLLPHLPRSKAEGRIGRHLAATRRARRKSAGGKLSATDRAKECTAQRRIARKSAL